MNVSRNKWPMAKVKETKSNQNGLVPSVYLKLVIDQKEKTQKTLWNDLLIKLYYCSKVMCLIPTKEPTDVS